MKQPFVATDNNMTTLFLVEPEGATDHCSETFVFICRRKLHSEVLQGIFYSALDVDMLINV